MRLLTNKDLAERMQCHPRTVTRWARRLRVRASIGTHSSQRWTEADCRRLLAARERWAREHGYASGWEAEAKLRGDYRRARERRQLRLRL